MFADLESGVNQAVEHLDNGISPRLARFRVTGRHRVPGFHVELDYKLLLCSPSLFDNSACFAVHGFNNSGGQTRTADLKVMDLASLPLLHAASPLK